MTVPAAISDAEQARAWQRHELWVRTAVRAAMSVTLLAAILSEILA